MCDDHDRDIHMSSLLAEQRRILGRGSRKKKKKKCNIMSPSSTTTTTAIRKAPLSPTRREQINHDDFNLKEWGLKSRLVSRDSRRFSASYIRTIREADAARSFRSNLTVSSTTVSSPAYNYLTEEINPSTYSFTTALRALQARSSNCWELQSPELGLTLNSKWNEAEKYICNPFSGEVPMECLSAKTLGNASFRQLTGRITMSAPLVYSKQAYYHHHHHHHHTNNKPKDEFLLPVQEKTTEGTKEVGTQSAEPHLNYSSSSCNSSPPPASTPSIKDVRPPFSSVSSITRSMSEEKLEVKGTRENNTCNNNNEETKRSRENDEKQKEKKMGKQKVGECFSFRGCSLWMMMRHHHKGETRKNNASVHHYFHNRYVQPIYRSLRYYHAKPHHMGLYVSQLHMM